MILNNKKQVIGLVLTGLITVFSFELSGCTPLRCIPLEQTQLNINSVEYSNAGSVFFVCRNSDKEFVVTSDGVINNLSGEKYINEKPEFIAATDKDIVYAIRVGAGHELYRQDIITRESTLISNEYRVLGMKGNKKYVFIEVSGKKVDTVLNNIGYQLLLFDGTELIDPQECKENVEVRDDFSKFTYEGYDFYIDNDLKLDEPQVAYVEGDDFQYSCLPYNVYFKDGDEIIKINHHTQWIPEIDGQSEVNAKIIGFHDGCCYAIIDEKMFCMYDVYTQTTSTLYKAKGQEQLAGFSVEENKVFIIKNGMVYDFDLRTKQYETRLKLAYRDQIYCENLDGKSFFFSKDSHRDYYPMQFDDKID